MALIKALAAAFARSGFQLACEEVAELAVGHEIMSGWKAVSSAASDYSSIPVVKYAHARDLS